MLHKKITIAVTLLLVLAIATWVFAAGETIEQRSVLAGKVLPDGLVQSNANVREGDVLVNVSTVIGSAAAARATTDGIVQEVLVKPGDAIKTGDVLVRIKK